jgi:hypothetical protein
MTTFTTDFTAPPVRPRAERLTDGVIAQYVHELTSAAARPAKRPAPAVNGSATFATSSAQTAETAADPSASRAHDEAGLPKRSSCWSRGGRLMRPTLGQRMTGAR